MDQCKNTFTICNYFHNTIIILTIIIIQSLLFFPISMTHSLLVLVPQCPLQHPTTSSCQSPSTTLTHVRPPLAHTWQNQAPSAPITFPYKYWSLSQSTRSRSNTDTEMAQMAEEAVDAQKLRSEFLKVLRTRRNGEGELMTSLNCSLFNETLKRATIPTVVC